MRPAELSIASEPVCTSRSLALVPGAGGAVSLTSFRRESEARRHSEPLVAPIRCRRQRRWPQMLGVAL